MDGMKCRERTKTKFRVNCAVENCSSASNKNLDVCFHCFPKPNQRTVYRKNVFNNLEKLDQLKAWQLALRMKKVIPSMKVCSLHFKKDDYLLPDIDAKKRILKKNAIPSLNLPANSSRARNIEESEARLQRLIGRNNCKPSMNIENQKESEKVLQQQGDKEENECPVSDGEISMATINESIVPKHAFGRCNVGIQVKSDFSIVEYKNFIQSKEHLTALTGLESFDVLDAVVEIVKSIHGDKFEKNTVWMNTQDRIVLTFIKIKLNMSYICLSGMFHCSTKHCQRIFYNTVKILSDCLKPMIDWPTRKVISKNLPAYFEDFKDVRVVLDCTLIFIQQPSNLCCEISTYSNYKGSITCKFMTGVTPTGNISYISRVYSGKTSDSIIFQQSDLIKLLEPGDAVMVDKGFLIDEICQNNHWKCIRPPFSRDKKQFTKSEALLTSRIAQARVHVERANQRIKTFAMLGSTLPAVLIPLIEDIFTIVCAIINMSSSILKGERFMNQDMK